MRWRSTGGPSAATSSSAGREPAVQQRRGRGVASISACAARGPGPQATWWRTVSSAGDFRPRAADQGEDRVHHAFADRHAADQRLGRDQLLAGQHRPGPRRLRRRWWPAAWCVRCVEVGVGDVDLQQEAVELRFGQGIGALLLDRVLRGQHVERARQRVVRRRPTATRPSCHRLQQRRLGARAGAVDLVGHQQLAEHRARARSGSCGGRRRPRPAPRSR